MSGNMKFDFQKSILVIIVFVLGFLVLYKCDTNYSEVKSEHYRDTLTFVKTVVDTAWFDSVVVRTVTEIEKVQVFDFQQDGSKVFRFTSSVEDSLISGTIITGIKLKDTSLSVVGQYIDYTPKFPKYIYRVDSVFTTIIDSTLITKYNDKVNFMIGGNMDLGNKTTLTPTIGIQFKNKMYIETGYNPFNKTILIGAKFKIK